MKSNTGKASDNKTILDKITDVLDAGFSVVPTPAIISIKQNDGQKVAADSAHHRKSGKNPD